MEGFFKHTSPESTSLRVGAKSRWGGFPKYHTEERLKEVVSLLSTSEKFKGKAITEVTLRFVRDHDYSAVKAIVNALAPNKTVKHVRLELRDKISSRDLDFYLEALEKSTSVTSLTVWFDYMMWGEERGRWVLPTLFFNCPVPSLTIQEMWISFVHKDDRCVEALKNTTKIKSLRLERYYCIESIVPAIEWNTSIEELDIIVRRETDIKEIQRALLFNSTLKTVVVRYGNDDVGKKLTIYGPVAKG